MKKKIPPKFHIGKAECLYGSCSVVFDENSVYALGFTGLNEALTEFSDNFRGIDIIVDNEKATELIDMIFEKGIYPKIVLQGTDFQIKVWQELSKIPKGETITYAELAARIGKPKAARAVGNAVGANPIAYLVPCHRVVRTDKTLGGYRWGIEVKKKILEKEMI